MEGHLQQLTTVNSTTTRAWDGVAPTAAANGNLYYYEGMGLCGPTYFIDQQLIKDSIANIQTVEKRNFHRIDGS